jgi:hypothetical protein
MKTNYPGRREATDLLFSKAAFAAILLFLVSSQVAHAQVTYTVTGILTLVSGSDPIGLSEHEWTATTTLDQSMTPSASATTTTYSTNTYSGMVVQVAFLPCSTKAPLVAVTLTDNVGAPDTISLSNCHLADGDIQISGSVTLPDGFMITAVPAAIPPTVSLVSGTMTLDFEGTVGTFSLAGATLTAIGSPGPPTVTPSPAAWTPSAPLGSTTPLSQNVSFTTVPSPTYAAVSFATSVTTTDGGNWLSVTPAGTNTSSSINITVNPKGLTKPSYSGTVTLTYGPGYVNTTIPVTFNLTRALPPPSVVSLSPNAGEGLTQIFTAAYSDRNGLSDLSDVLVLFNTSVKMSGACAVVFVPGTTRMYLYDDAGTGLSAGVTPGSPARVSNSQCTLVGTDSYFTTFGNDLRLSVALSFTDTFVGSKNIYLDAVGKENSSGWVKEGTWLPLSLGPPSVGSLSPSTGSGSTQTFTAVYSDPDGLADLSDVVLLFNSSLKVSNACAVVYIPETNQLYLDNDAGTGLTAGITPGSFASVSNSQCTLAGTGSSFSTSGDSLTLNVALTFSGTFVGLKNGYLYAVGRTQSSGWIQKGAWTP